ncbi:hypothetical protein TRFO_26275 [Tritrichomonas foetus]|uniref:Myb-like DNA-binding domain containing protein n=1 Tax=Tritrichomonas foetus TaxID=1144522 RepID=A0A1J4K331_9EUKA|nr:hypothetical protein TRFO_26275 [Tritrichomonas foetus]|eukprot:OHT05849.1 hypothetical protein TRFO_26275 [Tritrichomonas foetus]
MNSSSFSFSLHDFYFNPSDHFLRISTIINRMIQTSAQSPQIQDSNEQENPEQLPLMRVARQLIADAITGLNLMSEIDQKQQSEALSLIWILIKGDEDINSIKAKITQISLKLGEVADKINSIINITNRPIKDNRQRKAQTSGRQPARVWREYEDRRLLGGIHRFGLNDWHQVSAFVGSGRNAVQCSQRWFRSLDPDISRDAWSDSENQLLADLVNELGDKSWKLIAEKMPRRSDVQCRYRYRRLNEKVPNQNSSAESSSTNTALSSPPETKIANINLVVNNDDVNQNNDISLANLTNLEINHVINHVLNIEYTNESNLNSTASSPEEENKQEFQPAIQEESKDLFDLMIETNFFAFGDAEGFKGNPFMLDQTDIIFSDCFSF